MKIIFNKMWRKKHQSGNYVLFNACKDGMTGSSKNIKLESLVTCWKGNTWSFKFSSSCTVKSRLLKFEILLYFLLVPFFNFHKYSWALKNSHIYSSNYSSTNTRALSYPKFAIWQYFGNPFEINCSDECCLKV